jgi:hypothetical protein
MCYNGFFQDLQVIEEIIWNYTNQI